MVSSCPVDVDVLVLGGGPAGATVARMVAPAGASVALAERSNYGGFRIGETLPPEVNGLLEQIGIRDSLERDGHHLPSPGTVAAWGSETPRENDFIFSPYGHGWHLDRKSFDLSLACLASKAGAQLILEARPVSCKLNRGGWSVEFETPDGRITVSARWVIDATGRTGWFARSQHLQRHHYDQLVAIIAVLDEPHAIDPRTYIEATPDGWWYVSALPENRAIAAFFTDSDLHDLRSDQAERLWDSRLATSQLVRERLSDTERTCKPRVVSCATTKAWRSAGDGWIAVGDAARSIDPLSSQGIAWAIASGRDAANVLLSAEPGSASALYESEWDDKFRSYLATRQSYYASEGRWLGAPFWHRRSTNPAPLPLICRSKFVAR